MWISEEQEREIQQDEERMHRTNAALRRRWATREAYQQERVEVGAMILAALPYYQDDDYDPWDLGRDISHVMSAAAESGNSVEVEARTFIEAAMRAWAKHNPGARY